MPSPGSRCRLGQRRRRSRVAVMASNRKRSNLLPEDHELEQSGEHHSPPRPSSRYTRSRSRSPTHGSPSPVFDHDLSTADRRSTPNSSSPVMNISPGGPSWWATGGARLTSLILVTFPKFLTLPGARALTPRRRGPSARFSGARARPRAGGAQPRSLSLRRSSARGSIGGTERRLC